MTARELRQKYLRFFESKGHTVHPSGSLVPYDVTGKLDESLLFNGAGMVQFKPYFRGIATPPNPRLATAQKCVRTGDIEVVGDDSHLTFFEMLGNFSFGDYFQTEAIAYSWEFLTSPEWLGLDPRRLAFTVFQEDDVAYNEWAKWLAAAGIEPAHRIFRLDEETNYWPAGAFSNGPPGPCGPNSEMFYWVPNDAPPPSGAYTREDYLRDEAAGLWLEIWNDVFIQYEWQGVLRNPERPSDGYKKSGMPLLPFRSVDTGMGLERTAAVLGGKRSVYDTDLFQPILTAIRGMEPRTNEGEAVVAARRIVADHIRTASFCIADGVLPGNSGRGYVLRRLIRRAVLKGQRVLGFEEPFFHLVFDAVLEAMGDHYRELHERADTIRRTLHAEETQFRRTLEAGSAMLQDTLDDMKGRQQRELPGEAAFRLYDTFGFPLEVTQELAAEAGLSVDLAGYEQAMREAQERSRGASGMDTVYGAQSEKLLVATAADAPPQTTFVGYDRAHHRARLVQISPRFDADGLTDGRFQVCLNETPFYAESGGQVGDTGVLRAEGFEFRVLDTWKEMGQVWHDVELVRLNDAHLKAALGPQGDFGGDPRFDLGRLKGLREQEIARALESGVFFSEVDAQVDAGRRVEITRNHTATHLLHAALRKTLGKHVTQAGSLVAPDALRFDFTHGQAMTPEEIAEVERMVNEHALVDIDVQVYADVPIEEAKRRGAMALFGEKYGDSVRMVQVGDFSLELCGGIHVRRTGEIGLFKILHEGSAAGGVRRVEAVTGARAYDWLRGQMETLRGAATLLKTHPHELVHAIEKTLHQLQEERKKREKAEMALAKGGGAGDSETVAVGPVTLWRKRFEGVEQKAAASVIDDVVARDPALLALGAVVADGKITFICKAGKTAVERGAHAGNILREVAKIAGGGGGGRPDFATAGGRDASKLSEALAAAEGVLGGQVGA